MRSVALTGNFGCGKSTVSRMFEELGAVVIDSDRVVHELLAEGGAGVGPVLAEFPDAAAPDGRSVDRPALARIVFADPAARRRLEALLHPLVVERGAQLAGEAREAGASLVVTDAPVLFEAADAGTTPDPRQRFDAVIVVRCDPDVQHRRIHERAARTGRSPEEADADAARRLAAQLPQEEKVARADFVIDNSGSLEATREQVRVVHSRVLQQPANVRQVTDSK